MILWRNIPTRLWLWRHDSHHEKNLTGPLWTCSCGSTILRDRWKS